MAAIILVSIGPGLTRIRCGAPSTAADFIGPICARLLAREGAKVVLADLRHEQGARLAAAFDPAGDRTLCVHHDVADEESWIGLMTRITSRFGRLDIAVNCAGVGAGPEVSPHEETLEHWRALMSVNLDGVFLGTKHALAIMRRGDPVRGSIVNISSVLGLVGRAGLEAYSASKGGMRLYSKSVALSCAEEH